MERPKKLQRLQDLKRSVPFCTGSALAEILQDIRDKGLPELVQKKHILESTKAALDKARYGPMMLQYPVEFLDGATETIWVTNFWSYLSALLSAGGSYSDLLAKTAARVGMGEERPLKLVLYADEVVPGNVLGKAERKTWAIYASFMDFPLQTLSSEYAWILLSCIRAPRVNRMHAGIGQCISVVLRSVFFNPMCPAIGGVYLPMQGGGIRLYIELSAMLQDGSAHKYCFNAKGDSGWKYCLLCSAHATVTAGSGLGDEDDEGQDPIPPAQLKLSDLLLHSDQELLDSFDRLQQNAMVMSKPDFARWEQACGLTYNKCALLLDPQLRNAQVLKPASQYLHDWMHCLCSAGIMQKVIMLLLTECPKLWILLQEFTALWTLPRHCNGALGHLFSKKHQKKALDNKKFGCTASDILNVLPILQHFVTKILLPQNVCVGACKAFLASAHLLDLLHNGQVWACCTAAAVQAAAEECLASYVDNGHKDWLIKKHHWILHFSKALTLHKKLPSCFAMERKHRYVVRFGAPVTKLKHYEESVLRELLADELHHLSQPDVFRLGVYLLRPTPVTKRLHKVVTSVFGPAVPMANCQCSATCHLNRAVASKGDRVLIEPWACGEVLGFIACNGQIYAWVASHKMLEDKESTGSAVWEASAEQLFVPAEQLLCPLVWNLDKGTGRITTLIPWPVRCWLKDKPQ